jgi:rRNA pseudouridine-1189 N-methylase Emg1 (Nep1/Mra1 family)
MFRRKYRKFSRLRGKSILNANKLVKIYVQASGAIFINVRHIIVPKYISRFE